MSVFESTPSENSDPERQAQLHQLFAHFYPVHYKIGMAIESILCANVLTRKQFAVLWMIHSSGEGGKWMARKSIEERLKSWLEIDTTAISKVLRELSSPPLGVVELVPSPQSAREKRVVLTEAGSLYIARVSKEALKFVGALMEDMPEDVMAGGIRYLDELSAGFDKLERSG